MMCKKIVIIDYHLGNLFSVNQALKNIGLETMISSDPNEIKKADALVLPGVGAFSDAMINLKNLGLIEPIKQIVDQGKPFFGICLGLQMLFDKSEEFGESEGLGIIPGIVKKFHTEYNDNKRIKVPQIAWNSIYSSEGRTWKGSPLETVREGEDFYFVHSFYVVPIDVSSVLSKTTYGSNTYASSILVNNIFACQFHPEKSSKEGLKVYKKWAELNNLI
jgi:imidazole glycerol-phosphate synthase subunit HisH